MGLLTGCNTHTNGVAPDIDFFFFRIKRICRGSFGYGICLSTLPAIKGWYYSDKIATKM